jgi:hypothetical protein
MTVEANIDWKQTCKDHDGEWKSDECKFTKDTKYPKEENQVEFEHYLGDHDLWHEYEALHQDDDNDKEKALEEIIKNIDTTNAVTPSPTQYPIKEIKDSQNTVTTEEAYKNLNQIYRGEYISEIKNDEDVQETNEVKVSENDLEKADSKETNEPEEEIAESTEADESNDEGKEQDKEEEDESDDEEESDDEQEEDSGGEEESSEE